MSNLTFAEKLFDATLIVQLIAFIVFFFDFPFLGQVVGFFYLSFLPGYLVLKVIRIDQLSLIERAIFSAGLSLAILMFIGLLSNEVFPILNLSPLSAFPSKVTICISTLLFYIASRFRSNSFPKQNTRSFRFFGAIPLLICVPLLTIFGTELAITSGNNFILLFLVILISTIVPCTLSQRLFPSKTYPVILLTISFFLLFSVTLMSKYLIGFDVNSEYYFANLTSVTSVWNRMIPHEYNAMLSITILPVLFSNFLNLDITWVFKAIYPLIFSLVPLSLFVTYRKLTCSARVAFLSAFFFVSIDVFYFQILGLARQMIAELFFALLILLIVDDKISLPKRELLFIVFSAALIVSHYGLSYIFMFYILLTLCLSPLIKRLGTKQGKLVTGKIVSTYLIMASIWYVWASPSVLKAFTDTGSHIYQSILEQTVGPGIGGLVPSHVSPLHEISKYLFYGLQLAIVVGVAKELFKYKTRAGGKSGEYLSMTLLSLSFLFSCLVVPFLASSFTMSRIYHVTSFFLAPMLVIGILSMLNLLLKVKRSLPASKHKRHHSGYAIPKNVILFIVSIILVGFFLFQVGFVYEISGDIPSSLSLSFNRLRTNPALAPSLWSAYAPEQDVYSAKWLSQHLNDKTNVYADRISNFQVLTSYGMVPAATFRVYDHFLSNTSHYVPKGAHIFLRKLNVINLTMEGPEPGRFWNTTAISTLLDDCNKIYSNGGSEIYTAP